MRTASLSSLLLGILLLAGCGSSSKSSTSASKPAPATTTAASSTAASSTAAPSTAAPIVIATKHADKLGTVLAAGRKRLTVYLFEADKGMQSSCTGECAKAWPPVTGTPRAAGKAVKSDLGTITRPDGATQVTYKGHPLYFFVKDKDSGDEYGQGSKAFGAGWYVLSPSGSKIDNT